MFESPPDVIPDELSADEYLRLGKWYREKNDYDKARQSLQRAINSSPGSQTAVEARNFMAQNVPVNEVPLRAIERLRDLQLSVITSPRTVVDDCRDLIAEYPTFEWPYQTLAAALLQISQVEEAIPLLEQSLAINPERIRSLASMAEAQIILMNYDKAQIYLDRIAPLVPVNDTPDEIRGTQDIQRYRDLTRSLQILVAIS